MYFCFCSVRETKLSSLPENPRRIPSSLSHARAIFSLNQTAPLHQYRISLPMCQRIRTRFPTPSASFPHLEPSLHALKPLAPTTWRVLPRTVVRATLMVHSRLPSRHLQAIVMSPLVWARTPVPFRETQAVAVEAAVTAALSSFWFRWCARACGICDTRAAVCWR